MLTLRALLGKAPPWPPWPLTLKRLSEAPEGQPERDSVMAPKTLLQAWPAGDPTSETMSLSLCSRG